MIEMVTQTEPGEWLNMAREQLHLRCRRRAMPKDGSSEIETRVVSPADAAMGILLASPYRSIRHLTCRYRDGELTIAGRVPSFYLKQLAQIAVQQLDGVERISNIVEVSGYLF
jgi:hypothetical protein